MFVGQMRCWIPWLTGYSMLFSQESYYLGYGGLCTNPEQGNLGKTISMISMMG